ncbi:pilus assembly protein TadG-related protein [Chloroflexota bacterium]
MKTRRSPLGRPVVEGDSSESAAWRDRQAGQTLIQVALFMTVLLSFLAIAIDVGNLYQSRRKMQNAADAGALAGSWQTCFGNPDDAESAAWEYAVTHNDADGADITMPNEWTVTVVATETRDLFLANIFGTSSLVVGARAESACGAAISACGLWPVGLREDRWAELTTVGCNTPFWVWSGDNPNKSPDCDIYDCDVNDDGTMDVLDIDARAWLDFSDITDARYPDSCTAAGCGADELTCWIQYDSVSGIVLPTCIAGQNGTIAAAESPVNSRIGDAVSIPIYDYMGCPGRACPGGNTYHAVAFGCVTVVGWEQQFELPRLDGANPPWKGKIIAVQVNCGGCDTYCGSTPSGSEPPPWAVRAVSLTE